MPETISVRDFAAGWCPSDDAANGRSNCLLQMDNLELDENGALTLIGGTNVRATLGTTANAHTMFSRYLNNVRCDYAALTDGSVWRNNASIFSGGDNTNAAFSTAYNYALICSGPQRIKDDGTTIQNLGINPPTAKPTAQVVALNAPWQLIASQIKYSNVGATPGFVQPLGTNDNSGGNDYLHVITDATTGKMALQSYGEGPYDATKMTSIAGTGSSTDDDFVVINGYTPNPFGMSFQLDVLLVAPDNAGDLVSDYYSYTVSDIAQGATFDSFTGAFTIKVRRSNFNRMGGGAQDWRTVYGIRITMIGQVSTPINLWGLMFGEPVVMQGGTITQFGTYEYAQINVNNTGSYVAKSVLGPVLGNVTIDGNCALITPRDPRLDDAQCNEAWIFRRGGNLGGTWYRVLVFTNTTGYGAMYDTSSDQAALTLNIKINLNLVSIASITDKIFDIVGPIQGRWYYFTTNFMYPSDINDPDLVDTTIAVRLTGSSTELIMWARAVSASVVLVGTSVNVYLLTGTFQTFPDNSIDVYYQPLGVKFPPTTYDAVEYGGAVYYFASDGWRVVTPTTFGTTYSSQNNSSITSPDTDALYRGLNRYNYQPPVTAFSPGTVRYPITIVKNKIWCFITGTGRCEVFDFTRKYWRTFNYQLGDVGAVTATQDGQVLACYNNDKKVRELNVASTPLIDGVTQQTFNLLFTYKDNNQPRQRKDIYTFKTRCFTNNKSISLFIFNEKSVASACGLFSANVPKETFIDLSGITNLQLSKSLQVLITGTSDAFYLQDWSIDYDSRPVPLTYLRVLAQNYGTTARKRIYTVPYQVDTLGNPILVTPTVDGVPQSSQSINSVGKFSFDYQFDSIGGADVLIGTDYEWIVNGQGQEFEFYGFQEIRNIEIFPDRRRMLTIPVTNFGKPVKKRVRGWPFVINTRGQNVSFVPIVDGATLSPITFNTSDKATVRAFFTTDVFGVDYSGYFIGNNDYEFWEALNPDVVQVLPEPKEFDQVGPTELFRIGKISKILLRVLPFGGTTIPYEIFFEDNSSVQNSFTVVDGKEDSYLIDVPQGTNGRILRVTLGPTNFPFHRYYMKFMVARQGDERNSENEWITIPQMGALL